MAQPIARRTDTQKDEIGVPPKRFAEVAHSGKPDAVGQFHSSRGCSPVLVTLSMIALVEMRANKPHRDRVASREAIAEPMTPAPRMVIRSPLFRHLCGSRFAGFGIEKMDSGRARG